MSRKVLIVRFISGCMLIASTPLAFCNTYYVSAAGNDTDGKTPATAYHQIQSAITNATNSVAADYAQARPPAGGDTIIVSGGNYDPFYTSVPGTQASPIEIIADPAGKRPTINFATSTGVSFRAGSAWTTLKGFTILGNAGTISYADASTSDAENNPANYPQFNSTCINVDGTKATSASQHPVHISIINNYVGYCSGGGIGTNQADYITITQNTVYCTSWWSASGTSAISIQSSFNSDSVAGLSTDPSKQKIFVTQNTIYASQELIPWDNSADMGNHKITDGEAIIIDTNLNRASPSANAPNIDPYAGVTVIENNAIYSNGSQAIEIFASDHVLVDHNSTYGDANDTQTLALANHFDTRAEFEVSYSTGDITVLNNIFVSTNHNSPPVDTKYNSGSIYFSHNVLWNTYQQGNTPGLITTVALNSTNQFVDPGYLAPPPQNGGISLQVRAGSPALSAGYGYLLPAVDILNRSRSSVVSVGAYDNASY